MVMMPRLQAERNLEAVRIAQIAGGQFGKDSDGQKAAVETLRSWEQEAKGENSTSQQKKTETTEQKDERRNTRMMLGDMGVKVIQKETSDGKS